jgi:hypothetical protein
MAKMNNKPNSQIKNEDAYKDKESPEEGKQKGLIDLSGFACIF